MNVRITVLERFKRAENREITDIFPLSRFRHPFFSFVSPDYILMLKNPLFILPNDLSNVEHLFLSEIAEKASGRSHTLKGGDTPKCSQQMEKGGRLRG